MLIIYNHIGCVLNISMQQDDKFIKAVELYRINSIINWDEVASYVGEGITADQCNKRWVRNIRPENKLLKQGQWEETEVCKLDYIVELLSNLILFIV